jgi:hypothetical protein
MKRYTFNAELIINSDVIEYIEAVFFVNENNPSSNLLEVICKRARETAKCRNSQQQTGINNAILDTYFLFNELPNPKELSQRPKDDRPIDLLSLYHSIGNNKALSREPNPVDYLQKRLNEEYSFTHKDIGEMDSNFPLDEYIKMGVILMFEIITVTINPEIYKIITSFGKLDAEDEVSQEDYSKMVKIINYLNEEIEKAES